MRLRVELEPEWHHTGHVMRFTVDGIREMSWTVPFEINEWESLLEVCFDRAEKLFKAELLKRLEGGDGTS